MVVDSRRIFRLNNREALAGPVVYWMSRDQRVADNWALLYAQQLALERKTPLAVVFCLAPDFLGATVRQYGFMLRSLVYTMQGLRELEIPFYLLLGDPVKKMRSFVLEHDVAAVVTDFDPIRTKIEWRSRAAEASSAAFFEVDAHNIVPCRFASPKQEYTAATFRPKLQRLLPEFLTEFPRLTPHPFPLSHRFPVFEFQSVLEQLNIDCSVGEVDWLEPGEIPALRHIIDFIEEKLPFYDELRNDPCALGQSGASPWLHFGHISAQRIALEIVRRCGMNASSEAFLEELVVRRELSDNFCLHNPAYDRVEGFPSWARLTLAQHRVDHRSYLYSREQFENAVTHDRLWNAAQRSMVLYGTMHGYLRMYWAKKILEWSPAVGDALATAVYLNDRYQLDGRDPNGYTGIAWSLGGVHDRAWGERAVFGKIRYMNDKGCRRKFNVDAYIESVG